MSHGNLQQSFPPANNVQFQHSRYSHETRSITLAFSCGARSAFKQK
jgi:hypothetical protein